MCEQLLRRPSVRVTAALIVFVEMCDMTIGTLRSLLGLRIADWVIEGQWVGILINLYQISLFAHES